MMSEGWSLYVIVLTVIMIAGTTWVLFGNRTRSSEDDRTTGHAHDGIEEYDNPLPAWWFHMFVITIVFSIGYLIVFPGMGNFKGVIGWTSLGKWENEVSRANEKYAAVFARYRDEPIDQLHNDKKAMKMAKRIFANNCAQCHGVDGRGSTGFPDLTDDDWLYGGSAEQILASIQHGRQAVMPPWGVALGDAKVDAVTQYVLSLSAQGVHSASTASEQTGVETNTVGRETFAMFCASCHGADGKGNPLLGAPNLADTIWLYGGDASEIAHSVRFGRNGVMPAHSDTVSESKIHLLAAYVYGLSHSATRPAP